MSEQKKVTKWVWVWDFDKEEQWLNTMAQSGWVLEKIGFCTYYFAPCQPGEYTIRLEMRNKDASYIQFMEDTGAEYIGRMMKWIYFRKKTTLGQFDIFSDTESKLAHLKKIAKGIKIVGIANLLIGLVNTFNSVASLGFLNLLWATLLMYALGRIHGKIEALEKERLLIE